MALLLCSILGLTSVSVAKPSNLLTTDRTLNQTTEPLSPFSLSSNKSINAINSTLDLSATYTICLGERGGFDLIGDQCKQALVNSDFARIPPNEMLTFEPRSSPSLPGQIGLPRRYHSSDGRCAIEPFLPVGVLSARGTARTFNEAANKLIYKCVDHNAHKGGLTYNVGGDNNLDVKVFSFDPKVQCYGSLNRQTMIPSCNNLADKMNASPELVPFTSRHSWIPKVIILPHREVDPAGGGCRLAVSFQKQEEEPIQFSSWYAVWQAVVAIDAMCVRNGQRGKWLSLGHTIEDAGTIDVDVGEAQAGQRFPVATVA